MSFVSAYFLAFFAFGLLVYRLLPGRWRKAWLLLLSFFFVSTYSLPFGILLFIFSSLLYITAIAVERYRRRAVYIVASAILLLAILFVFFSKFGFLLDGLNVAIGNWQVSLPLDIQLIFVPVGISFLILQTVAYVIDVHLGRIPARRSWLDVTLYVLYFPKILAGPIERPGHFFKKIEAPSALDEEKFWRCFYLLFIGFVRKILIADPLMSLLPARAFTASSTTVGFQALFSLLAFSIGLYNDFAGYSDIARGVSGLFGIDLVVNFRYPFQATSFSDFWRRWHISLSDFLRDYIYFPLTRVFLKIDPGHERLGTLFLPPIATMLVSGLWHGISWNMVVWGGLQGLLLAIERLIQVHRKTTVEKKSAWRKAFSIVMVFSIVTLLWIPFKAGLAGGWVFLRNLLGGYGSWADVIASVNGFFLSLGDPLQKTSTLLPLRGMVLLVFAIALDLVLSKGREDESMMRWPAWVRILALSVFTILMLLFSMGDTLKLFIYQGF
jgi:alginate O-acetyltransferase complex protein AlgI